MYGYIYITTNLINNKKYIGQHRSEVFDNKYLGSGKLLSKALEKYGRENFHCELIFSCESEEELNQQEKMFIEKYNAVKSDDFYNIADGGLGHTCNPWNKDKKNVQKVTQKQLDALERGRHLPSSEKQKQVLRENRKKFVASDETREKLRIAGGKARRGKKMLNNGKICKFFTVEEIPLRLEEGWKFGMIKNN